MALEPDLIGLKAVNREGAYLGEVREVTIEHATRALTELEANSGGHAGLGWHGDDDPLLCHPRHWTGAGHGGYARANWRGEPPFVSKGGIVSNARAVRIVRPTLGNPLSHEMTLVHDIVAPLCQY